MDAQTYIRNHLLRVRENAKVFMDKDAKMADLAHANKMLDKHNTTYIATLIRQYNLMLNRSQSLRVPPVTKRKCKRRAEHLFGVIEEVLQSGDYETNFWCA